MTKTVAEASMQDACQQDVKYHATVIRQAAGVAIIRVQEAAGIVALLAMSDVPDPVLEQAYQRTTEHLLNAAAELCWLDNHFTEMKKAGQ